jgi:hypothetical protein
MANLNINVTDGNNLTVAVTPVPSQTIQINRGVAGPPGPAGGAIIAGYPVNCNSLILHDVLMFGVNEWVNTNQTEITDGGNF